MLILIVMNVLLLAMMASLIALTIALGKLRDPQE